MERPYLQEVADAFVDYVRHEDSGDLRTLGAFFDEWVMKGGAIKATGGDFTLFHRMCGLVLMMYHEDPNLFGQNREDRPIFGVRYPVDELPGCFDQDWWNSYVFEHTYGHGRSR
jgi:hypothetical protein